MLVIIDGADIARGRYGDSEDQLRKLFQYAREGEFHGHRHDDDPVRRTVLLFDDVEKLRTKISDAFSEWSESIEVTQDMINRFAELTGDHQWIHVDVERAKRESPFRTTIAHGFLTLSLLPCMHSNPSWKIAGYGNATNYGADKLRFVSPVPAGAKVHARSRLVAVEGRPQGTQVKQEIQVQVVGQERPALIYEMLVLYHPPMKRAAG